jgi:hypothetical protein
MLVRNPLIVGYCTGPADIQCCIYFEPDAHDDTAANNNVYYYQNWCGGSLQYLDDALCAKSFPSSYDRDWKCPVPVVVNTSSSVKNLLDAGYIPDQTLSDVSIDTNTLGKIITNGANYASFYQSELTSVRRPRSCTTNIFAQANTQPVKYTRLGPLPRYLPLRMRVAICVLMNLFVIHRRLVWILRQPANMDRRCLETWRQSCVHMTIQQVTPPIHCHLIFMIW